MSRIDAIFAALKADDRAALMPFVVAGAPSLETTATVLQGAEAAGADIVEVGFPFSDPIADGPVISAAMYEAIQSGTTPARVFDLVSRVRPDTGLGLVAMVSESIVHRIGAEKFIAKAAAAGFDGLLVPDVDLSVAAELSAITAGHDMAFTMLIAPTTSDERIGRITTLCRGFVYVLARTGLTGEQTGPPAVAARLATIRQHTDLPLAVGFGISTAEHVKQVTQTADAAIVGSALVRRMAAADDPAGAALKAMRELASGLQPAGRV